MESNRSRRRVAALSSWTSEGAELWRKAALECSSMKESRSDGPQLGPAPAISRRGLLKRSAGVIAAAGVAGTAPAALNGQAPAIVTARRFRGWVSRGVGQGRTTLQEMTLRPIS